MGPAQDEGEQERFCLQGIFFLSLSLSHKKKNAEAIETLPRLTDGVFTCYLACYFMSLISLER